MDYVFEKVKVSVQALAAGTGTIQSRLWSSYVGLLSVLEERDFPTERLKKKFKAIIAGICDHEKCPKLTELEAHDIAEKIVELLVELVPYVERDNFLP